MPEYDRSTNFDLPKLAVLWHEGLGALTLFSERELAAHALFMAVARNAGVEATNTEKERDRPNILGSTTYNPVSLVTEGYPTVYLAETYEILTVHQETEAGFVAFPIKRKVMPNLQVKKNDTAVITSYDRTALVAIDAMVRGEATGTTWGLLALLDVMRGPGDEQPDALSATMFEQDSYIGWLKLAADQLGLNPSDFSL